MKICMGCMEEYDESLSVCPHCGYVENTKPAEVYHMMPGSILAKKYIVGRTLGYGGFGVTYIGRDMELQRKVAIKEYLPGEFSTRIPGQTMVTVYEDEKHEQFQSGITKFMDEAKRLAKFQDSAGIVHIYDSFFENETAYIVMEYIEGETVKEKLEREGKIPVDEALKLILPIVAAMKEVHAEGIIHRDISPDNIMVDKEGNAKLIDFGASRYATTTHSKSLSVLIKYGYAPMEQYQSGGQQGTWTDVYALAATFYTMVTGVVPEDSLKRLEKDELKPLSKMGIKISKNVDMAIRNALNVKVEERTPSMEAFEEELLSEGEVARLVTKQERKDVGAMPVWVKAVTGCGIACVAAFVVLLLTGVISFSGGNFGSFVVAVGKTIVPNMVNVTVDQAEAAGNENKLQIQIGGKNSSEEIPAGYILEQSIKPGTKVDEGSILHVKISAGVEMVYMPSVEGLTKEQAKALLEEQGLRYVIEEVEDATAPGYVVSQSIAEDEKIVKGTEITLKVSKGMADIDTEVEVEVPNLTGVDYAEAQKQLAKLGLYLGKESEVYDSKIKKGCILYQSVPAGNKLHQGGTVLVQVSKGKEQVHVPDVVYDKESDAKEKLTKEGLMAKVEYRSHKTIGKGYVISQGIKADSLVDIGTTITIVVSTGTEDETDAENTKEEVKDWSGWVESLPAGITSDKYEIETRAWYSYSDKQVLSPTTDATLKNQGYTIEKEDKVLGEWSSFSEWTTTEQKVENSETQNVEKGWQYRDKETKSSNTPLSGWDLDSTSIIGYTDWSGWMDLPADNAGGTRNIDYTYTDNLNDPQYKDYYRYTRYVLQYKDPDNPSDLCKHWGASRNSVNDYYKWITAHKGWPYSEHNCDTGWIETQMQKIANSTTGDARWTGYDYCGEGVNDWYNENHERRLVGYGQKQVWRYQDPIYQYNYSRWNDNWSTPSSQEIAASATRQVRNVWRMQTRTLTIWYTYSKWSDYSQPTTEKRTYDPTITKEKVTKTEYRYKKK